MGIYSPSLGAKIDSLSQRRCAISLGSIKLASPLILAPMSSLCHAPFRLLMEELGAGATVSELISCHGINRKNQVTLDMLRIDAREKNVGIQLFGEDGEAMARAAEIVCERGKTPAFIDINMGCPVRKVVSKGAGAALLRRPDLLGKFFRSIKRAIPIPLTIKIRTGWDVTEINAREVIAVAEGEGVEFVAIHGRTRAQKYQGQADWKLLEGLVQETSLSLVGNGDLHSPEAVRSRLAQTNMAGLMLGRGPLRHPFLFLTSLLQKGEVDPFHMGDYWEVVRRYNNLLEEASFSSRNRLIQIRKIIPWFAAGLPGASALRKGLFQFSCVKEVLLYTRDFFLAAHDKGDRKASFLAEGFLTGGHG